MANGGTDGEDSPPIVPGHVPQSDPLPQPFNMQKATFYLVAAVCALYGVALLYAEIACLWWLVDKCINEATGKIAEGFASLLASAFAFAAGQRSGMPPPKA